MGSVALVAGATGIIGKALLEEIADAPNWTDPIDTLIDAIRRQIDAHVLPSI